MALELDHLVAAGVVAGAVSFAVTPLVARIARRLGVLARPGGYRTHAVPTPQLGGLAIAAGTFGGAVLFLQHGGKTGLAGFLALGSGMLVIVIAGLLDDIRVLSPARKFLWQVSAAAAAGLCLALLGVRLNLFLHWPAPPIILLTVLWVVTITNALNLLDNLDGLCTGLGAVAAFSLAITNLRSGELNVALVAVALGGACLGFLPYNWPRARVFLGDTGSMLIGFLLAALSVMGVYTRGAHVPVISVFTPLFVLAVPLLDLVLVIILRLRAGHRPWVGDRRHISHRLMQRGMHPAAVVVTLWAAGAACGLAALLLPTVGAAEAPLLAGLLACALGALAATAGTKGQG